MKLGCVVVVGSLVFASAADAGVTYTDVERNIEVLFGPAAPSVSLGRYGTGVWDESVMGSYADDLGAGSGVATQTSDVSGRLVTMSGHVSAFGTSDGYANSSSTLSVFITLEEATGFRASAALFDLFQGNPTLSFKASLYEDAGHGADLWSMSSVTEFIPDAGSFAFGDESGVLGPGTYLLDVRISVDGFKDVTTSGAFSFELSVPSPGGVGVAGVGSLALAGRRRRA
ncbi:MAG: hypothetical protein R3B57_05325 [Phycisphaerales bacterium]